MPKWIQIQVVSSEESAMEQTAQEGGPAGSGLQKAIAIGGSLLVLLGVAVAIWFFGFRESDSVAQGLILEPAAPAAAAPPALPANPAGVSPGGAVDTAALTLSEDEKRRLNSEKRVAIVNGEPITEAMLEREVGIGRVLYPVLRGIPIDNDPQTLERMRSDILSSMIDEQLLVQAARKAGVQIDDAEVEARLNRMLENGQLSREALTERLAAVGVTLEDMKASLRNTMMAEQFVVENPPPEGINASSSYNAWVKALQKEGEVQVLVGDQVAKVVKIGQPAPDFILRSPTGEVVSLSQYAGQPLIINFWATWCAPCRFEMPLLQQTYESYHKDGLVVLAINVQEDVDVVDPYLKEMGLTFPVALDRGGAVAAAYRVTALPTTIFVDTNGIVTNIHRGALVERTLQGYLSELLAGVENKKETG